MSLPFIKFVFVLRFSLLLFFCRFTAEYEKGGNHI